MNRKNIALSLMPTGLLLTVLGVVFLNELGGYKNILLLGGVLVLLCSVLLILASLIKRSPD